MQPAVFLDRDNTLIHNDADLGDPAQVRLIQGSASAIASLKGLGYRIVVVSNQGGVARGVYREDDVEAVHERINELIRATSGASIDRFYYCPYHPEAKLTQYRRDHPWRKPQPGMLLQAARDMGLDLSQSWMVGDQLRDIEAGAAAGCRTILLTPTAEELSPLQLEQILRGQTGRQREPGKVAPDYEARNVVEAVRIIAQKRKPESAEEARARERQTRRWDATTARAARGIEPPPAAPPLPPPAEERETARACPAEPGIETPGTAAGATPGAGADVAGNGHQREETAAAPPYARPAAEDEASPAAATAASDSRPQPIAPAPAPIAPAPAHPRAAVAGPAPPRALPPVTPAPPPPPALPPPTQPESARPEKASTPEEPPREAPPPVADAPAPPPPDDETVLRQILQELRHQRSTGDDFSYLKVMAIVLQMVALVCLLGGLWMGSENNDTFIRWLGAALVLQLTTVAILLFDR